MTTAHRRQIVESLDGASLAGICAGVALAMQPWWSGGLRAGFFMTLGATLLQIVASHALPEEDA